MNLEVIIDEQVVSMHGACVTVNGDEVRVTVSPRVEAAVLAMFTKDLALAIADAVTEAAEKVAGVIFGDRL
jgi:hypothetical protein